KGGPAFHLHYRQDEWFYVIKGDFIVRVADDTFTLKPGDSAFAPRTIPHAFAKTSDGEGQMLVLFQPAGMMESHPEQFRMHSQKPVTVKDKCLCFSSQPA
ncbi:MAG: cupin domain-containing protein, partial [Bacteroidetes bacterium]